MILFFYTDIYIYIYIILVCQYIYSICIYTDIYIYINISPRKLSQQLARRRRAAHLRRVKHGAVPLQKALVVNQHHVPPLGLPVAEERLVQHLHLHVGRGGDQRRARAAQQGGPEQQQQRRRHRCPHGAAMPQPARRVRPTWQRRAPGPAPAPDGPALPARALIDCPQGESRRSCRPLGRAPVRHSAHPICRPGQPWGEWAGRPLREVTAPASGAAPRSARTIEPAAAGRWLGGGGSESAFRLAASGHLLWAFRACSPCPPLAPAGHAGRDSQRGLRWRSAAGPYRGCAGAALTALGAWRRWRRGAGPARAGRGARPPAMALCGGGAAERGRRRAAWPCRGAAALHGAGGRPAWRGCCTSGPTTWAVSSCQCSASAGRAPSSLMDVFRQVHTCIYWLCLLGAAQRCPLTSVCRAPAPALPYCHCPAFVSVLAPVRGAPRPPRGRGLGFRVVWMLWTQLEPRTSPFSTHPRGTFIGASRGFGILRELGGRGAVQSHLGEFGWRDMLKRRKTRKKGGGGCPASSRPNF